MVSVREARRQNRIPKKRSMSQKRSEKNSQSLVGQICYKFFYTLSFKKCLFAVSLFVSVQVSDAYVKVLSTIVFFGLNFSFLDWLYLIF
jgi:hypothetical protein